MSRMSSSDWSKSKQRPSLWRGPSQIRGDVQSVLLSLHASIMIRWKHYSKALDQQQSSRLSSHSLKMTTLKPPLREVYSILKRIWAKCQSLQEVFTTSTKGVMDSQSTQASKSVGLTLVIEEPRALQDQSVKQVIKLYKTLDRLSSKILHLSKTNYLHHLTMWE
jgi:hypothetical protein